MANDWVMATADNLWDLAWSGKRHDYCLAYIDNVHQAGVSERELVSELLLRTETGFGYHLGPLRVALTRILQGLGVDGTLATTWTYLALADPNARRVIMTSGEYAHGRLANGLYYFIGYLATRARPGS